VCERREVPQVNISHKVITLQAPAKKLLARQLPFPFQTPTIVGSKPQVTLGLSNSRENTLMIRQISKWFAAFHNKPHGAESNRGRFPLNQNKLGSRAGQPGRVVIVGAGPAGMALAYLLARRGVGVTVLEAHHDFARVFRGEGLQQSGIDTFRQMGLGERLETLPQVEMQTVEFYLDGRRIFRAGTAEVGRDRARLVSQPAVLQMLADEAGKYPSFQLAMGVSMRDFLREDGRVVGVRASNPEGPTDYRADLVIGADGRHAATRKHSGFSETSIQQTFDVLWVKVPFPACYPNRATIQAAVGSRYPAIAFPTADGQLQVGFFIPKGGFAALRARGAEVWTEELIRTFPGGMADHLRAHREAVAGATMLNVVCGRLTQWTAPGLLLIGDAAHPMSPVGGQGVNIALRDALVAANHLCPVLSAGADAAAIDAAARRVQDERWPEIVAVQEIQEAESRRLANPEGWRSRLAFRLLPLLMRTGLLQWLQRKQNRQMSYGVVPVRLAV
jgi:2-polyprenyl-6-methoxyphenol hydroxylase-like FAD-dependent oxidoreductase